MFKLEIETTNAAFVDFGPEAEIARILRNTANRVEDGGLAGPRAVVIKDVNGNEVGGWHYFEEDSE